MWGRSAYTGVAGMRTTEAGAETGRPLKPDEACERQSTHRGLGGGDGTSGTSGGSNGGEGTSSTGGSGASSSALGGASGSLGGLGAPGGEGVTNDGVTGAGNEVGTTLTGMDAALTGASATTAVPGGELAAPSETTGPLDAVDVDAEVGREIKAYEALIGPINPHFNPFDLNDPYSNNCGSSVLACMGRLNGSNPEAVAGPVQIGTVAEMNALTGMHQTPTTPEAIQAYAEAAGPGYHAIVGLDWVGTNSGHWVCVSTSPSRRVYCLDPQSGAVSLFSEYVKNTAPPGVAENWDISL